MPLGRLSLELAGRSEHMLGSGERDILARPLLGFSTVLYVQDLFGYLPQVGSGHIRTLR